MDEYKYYFDEYVSLIELIEEVEYDLEKKKMSKKEKKLIEEF
jgi:hypothetical protein